MGQKLNEMWNQPVVIGNRPGGSTVIGAELVARAAPDGYTMLIGFSLALACDLIVASKTKHPPKFPGK